MQMHPSWTKPRSWSRVDCSKLDNDDARKKCREAKVKH
jgi:hypothetical protein